MSAELLRRAAAELRKRAGDATPGPWRAREVPTQAGFPGWVVDGDEGTADHAWVASMEFGEHKGDAEYIAMVHPTVGLLFADWLDRAARDIDEAEVSAQRIEARAVSRRPAGWPVSEFAEAVAVARDILREPEGGVTAERPWAVPKDGRRATTSADRAEMRRRYEAGETCAEIAEDYPVSTKTVHQTLTNMGVQMRAPGGRPGRRSRGSS